MELNKCTRCGHYSTAHFATDGACTDCACAHYLGFIEGLDDKTYFGSKESLSASSAKILLGSRPPTSKDALEFGTLTHTALLEPHKLVLPNFLVLDPSEIGLKKDGTPADAPKQTAAWKKRVEEAEKEGFTVVTPDEEEEARAPINRALAMVKAVKAHPKAKELLDACPGREVAAFAEFQPGVIVRGKFDLLGDGAIADFKTCADGNPDEFHRIAHSYGYYLQAFVYEFLAQANGIDTDGLHFILCEKLPTPGGNYRVSVTRLDDLFVDLGRKDFGVAVRRWLALGKRVDLPNYPDEEVIVGMPAWLINDEMELA